MSSGRLSIQLTCRQCSLRNSEKPANWTKSWKELTQNTNQPLRQSIMCDSKGFPESKLQLRSALCQLQKDFVRGTHCSGNFPLRITLSGEQILIFHRNSIPKRSFNLRGALLMELAMFCLSKYYCMSMSAISNCWRKIAALCFILLNFIS